VRKRTIEEWREREATLDRELDGLPPDHIAAFWFGEATDAIRVGDALGLAVCLQRLGVASLLKEKLVELLSGQHSDWRLVFHKRHGRPAGKTETAARRFLLGKKTPRDEWAHEKTGSQGGSFFAHSQSGRRGISGQASQIANNTCAT
jgi:hypothetical protein